MKVAVTSKGDGLDAELDPRFGRAHSIIVATLGADGTVGEPVAHENSLNLNAMQGAGIQTAEMVARLGAEALISGHIGPKAFRALRAAGIKVYTCGPATVADALGKLAAGELTEVASPDVPGHWA